jgi:hypothetical protein
VAQLLSRSALVAPDAQVETVLLNGTPAVRIDYQGAAITAAISLAVQGGRISRIYAVANPQKLARLDTETLLTR